MEQRLRELRLELEKGRQRLEFLDGQRQEVRDTILRISGAIQVLEELRATGSAAPQEELAAMHS